MIEAVIGACYLAFGYEPMAEAVVEAFSPEIEDALEHPVDFKSALQERLARRGLAGQLRRWSTSRGRRTTAPSTIGAMVDGEEIGRGTGRSKKDAEQEAAQICAGGLWSERSARCT